MSHNVNVKESERREGALNILLPLEPTSCVLSEQHMSSDLAICVFVTFDFFFFPQFLPDLVNSTL